MSTTMRRPLRLYVFHNVAFDSFPAREITQVDNVGLDYGERKRTCLFELSLSVWSSGSGEVHQLVSLSTMWGMLFRAFDLVSKPQPSYDITFSSTSNGHELMLAEGKEPCKLPARPLRNAANVCTFGFACCVAKTNYDGCDGLATILGLPISSTKRDPCGEPSTIVRKFLQPDNGLKRKLGNVRNLIATGQLGGNDPVYLWEATVQACSASCRRGWRYTMVLSAHCVFFVKLTMVNNDCTVQISNGLLFGEPGSLLKVIKFVKHAEGQNLMTETDQRKWGIALPLPKKQVPGEKENNRALACPTLLCPITEHVEMDYLDRDHTAIIPFWGQMEDVVCEVGRGRSGCGEDSLGKRLYGTEELQEHGSVSSPWWYIRSRVGSAWWFAWAMGYTCTKIALPQTGVQSSRHWVAIGWAYGRWFCVLVSRRAQDDGRDCREGETVRLWTNWPSWCQLCPPCQQWKDIHCHDWLWRDEKSSLDVSMNL